jgi:hypothetical protein
MARLFKREAVLSSVPMENPHWVVDITKNYSSLRVEG